MVIYLFNVVICLVALFRPVPSQADEFAYTGTKDIKVEDDVLIVEHHHHWYGINHHTMVRTHQDPFRSDNDYAYIRCTDKRTGKILWQHPTPALTYLWISPNSRFIVGCSRIKINNPYQLVIFERSGELIMKKHISPEEAGMTAKEFLTFTQRFPAAMENVDGLLFRWNDSVYVDFLRMDMFDRLGDEAWSYLFDYIRRSPYSPNFTESVTNHIYWFDESNPSPQLHFTGTTLTAISLRDPKGIPFKIPLH